MSRSCKTLPRFLQGSRKWYLERWLLRSLQNPVQELDKPLAKVLLRSYQASQPGMFPWWKGQRNIGHLVLKQRWTIRKYRSWLGNCTLQLASLLLIFFWHNSHWNMRMMQNVVTDTAQYCAADTAKTTGPHHYECHTMLLGSLADAHSSRILHFTKILGIEAVMNLWRGDKRKAIMSKHLEHLL